VRARARARVCVGESEFSHTPKKKRKTTVIITTKQEIRLIQLLEAVQNNNRFAELEVFAIGQADFRSSSRHLYEST
jgi:hypothetical protein